MKSVRVLVPAAVVLALVGCSSDDLAEKMVERQIESQSGEDVDIDLDDGDISIQTEDGEISIQTDDDGNVTFQSEDGEISMQSEDGQTVIESDDATIIASSSGDLPDDFPDDLPLPTGVVFEYTQSMSTPDGQNFVVGGRVDGLHGDVITDYLAILEAAGFTQQLLTTNPDGSFFAYDDGTWIVGGTASADAEGGTEFAMTVTPSTGG